jgi:hypothetical protein
MFRLSSFFNTCRSSHRLIQAVALAFVLSLGVAVAAPALQTANLSPDTQVICLGNGGMKTVTFAADGTATEVQTAHSPSCLLCAALQALPLAGQVGIGLAAASFAHSRTATTPAPRVFESRIPPARAPPAAS